MLKRPPVQIRHSSLNTLLGVIDPHAPGIGRSGGCSLAYQVEYCRGYQADPGIAALKGICFHVVFAKWKRWLGKNRLSGRLPHHKARLLQILESEMKVHGIPDYEFEDMRELTMHFGATYKYDKDATYVVEQRWFFTLNWEEIPGNGVRPAYVPEDDYIGMTLDELKYKPTPREIYFRDEKTGDGARGMDYDEDAKHSEQLQMYACGVFSKFPECEKATGELAGIRGGEYNRSSWEFRRETVFPVVNDRISDGRKRLDELWAEFGTDAWPATGDHAGACRYCSIPGGCPKIRGMFIPEAA